MRVSFCTSSPTLTISCIFYYCSIYWGIWLIESHRFQMNVSWCVICILHCVPTPQSQIIFHHPVFDVCTLYYPPPTISPSNHHTVVCVCGFQFYIPHTSEIIWSVAFSDRLISLSIIFSRSIHVVTNGSVSGFFFFNKLLCFMSLL